MTDLTGKKVRINADKMLAHEADIYPILISFIKKNRDTIFTATPYPKYDNTYTFRENDDWCFRFCDLIEVED